MEEKPEAENNDTDARLFRDARRLSARYPDAIPTSHLQNPPCCWEGELALLENSVFYVLQTRPNRKFSDRKDTPDLEDFVATMRAIFESYSRLFDANLSLVTSCPFDSRNSGNQEIPPTV